VHNETPRSRSTWLSLLRAARQRLLAPDDAGVVRLAGAGTIEIVERGVDAAQPLCGGG
jgi:hypothetical protein